MHRSTLLPRNTCFLGSEYLGTLLKMLHTQSFFLSVNLHTVELWGAVQKIKGQKAEKKKQMEECGKEKQKDSLFSLDFFKVIHCFF